MPVRAIALLVLALAAAPRQPAEYPAWFREAIELGRTQDEALFAAFNKGYSLSPSGIIDSAQVITEFRRAVLIVREHTLQGDFSFGPRDLDKALLPNRGLLTFVVQVRLNPLNTFMTPPLYDLYISTGPATPPIGPKPLKRDPVYPPGGSPGSQLIGARLEASFPRDAIAGAPDPYLIVTDDRAGILWQARIDLARYR